MVDLTEMEIFEHDKPTGNRQRRRRRTPIRFRARPSFGTINTWVGGNVLHRATPRCTPAFGSVYQLPELPQPIGARLPHYEMPIRPSRGLSIRRQRNTA